MNDINKPISPDMHSQDSLRRNRSKITLSFLGKNILIKGENKRKFEVLRAKIIEEIEPATEIERVLCEKFIFAVWNHDRAIEVERNMLNAQNQIKKSDGSDSRVRIRNICKVSLAGHLIQKVLIHRTAIEKNMLKTLERIREEQRFRLDKKQGINPLTSIDN
jgi:hypothetical protein